MAKDLNQARVEDLEQVPQIGREKAEAIINHRDEIGGYTSWDELESIPGFEEGMVENIKQAGFDIVGGEEGMEEGGMDEE